jgi:hypothetical protein
MKVLAGASRSPRCGQFGEDVAEMVRANLVQAEMAEVFRPVSEIGGFLLDGRGPFARNC